MAKYGTFKYGDGTKYGVEGRVTPMRVRRRRTAITVSKPLEPKVPNVKIPDVKLP